VVVIVTGDLTRMGKLFVGVLAAYICVAAVTGRLTVEVLVIRLGVAMVTAMLIGIAYRLRANGYGPEWVRSERTMPGSKANRQWRFLMLASVCAVVGAFVVSRVA
jgi:hypothetical protein